ncbi:hypothetical protein M670_00338 [Schinkia azotoformans MEV2011]|uniref:Uncharacterized protein n=1 Tax=Schinkia azotoformans MEV2011 TaxID=1348973 RepID=A0A072NSW0_SCHAZ|nr:hypothetical protein [Schinkia azotoformans]KEF40312.1 hypothetical protein M670_00338 [Schinkia azotoformans MEV2011]MEC1696379.1 hypothetical protein [Schinkia azotoformans]MEC1715549.1 hypothetical protein [Schinkia azotoformans]MEC1724051.1 hypothetical protein [Schinkia azotoformans]MEC1743435.1 hypothetical protein [Schinkia azotoformans]
MNKDELERKKFLEDQLQWCKEQDRILEEIESKLYEMKKIAAYALKHDLSLIEINELNGQLGNLKNQVKILEKRLQSIVH